MNNSDVNVNKHIFKVLGDHPVGKRIDKTFRGKDAEFLALRYADELFYAGYENVKVIDESVQTKASHCINEAKNCEDWGNIPLDEGFYWYLGKLSKNPTIYEVSTIKDSTGVNKMIVSTFHSGEHCLSSFLKAFKGGRWKRIHF